MPFVERSYSNSGGYLEIKRLNRKEKNGRKKEFLLNDDNNIHSSQRNGRK